MNKKGFTLIELLAVIVILAIVALIATPLILNVIEESRKNAFKNSAYGLIEAVELDYAKDIMEDGIAGTREYEYSNYVQVNPEKQLEYKGSKPKVGNIKINEKGQIALAIYDGIYCAEKSFESSEVKLFKMEEEDCILIDLPDGGVCGDSFVDKRDNDVYKTVKIGSQCWFAENLRYVGEGEDSCLPDPNNPFNCEFSTWESGSYNNCCIHKSDDESFDSGQFKDWIGIQVMYQFDIAKTICPSNWHLASDEEWKYLEGYVDSQYKLNHDIWNSTGERGSDAGKKLKSSVYWNGTNEYGFNALPVGYRDIPNVLSKIGKSTEWWTFLIDSGDNIVPYSRMIHSDIEPNKIWRYGPLTADPSYGFAVRCILNNE